MASRDPKMDRPIVSGWPRSSKDKEKQWFFDDSQFPLWALLDVLGASPVRPRATLGPTKAPAEVSVGTLGGSPLPLRGLGGGPA